MWLRGGRTQRGLSLDDVARVTKIQVRILERLEAGKLDGLPADVFVRGFVRSFARCVGLDETESLKRYAACGDAKNAAAAGPAARAVIDAMAELAPSNARTTPRALRDDRAAITDDGAVAGGSDAESSPPAAAPVVEPALAAIATAVEPSAAAAPVPSAAIADGPKKKRRGKNRGAKRKAMAVGTPWAASPIVAAPATTEVARTGEATTVVTPAVEPAVEPAAEPAAVVAAPASEPASELASEPVEPDVVVAAPASESHYEISTISAEALAFAEASVVIPLTAVDEPMPPAADAAAGDDPVEPLTATAASGTWMPKMPAPSAASSVPWRRPGYVAAVPVASLVAVIDDADPDSAERDLEERRSTTKEPRRSFLPPILLDREDRSARQGGLTLAVIILLIAATLTLSYLMRRPSSSGDGVTRTETSAPLQG
jgi:hypothetical protein